MTMAKLTRDAIAHLLGGERLTARRQATHREHEAWVGVVSLEKPCKVYLNTADESMLGRMLVRWFEVPQKILGSDFAEEELVDSQRSNVVGVNALVELLERLGVDPATLDYTSATGYPL